MTQPDMRSFIQAVLRETEGNALLSLATGKTPPTEKSPNGKLKVNEHHWFAYPSELDLMVAFAEKAYVDRRDAYLSPVIYGAEPYHDKEGRLVPVDRDGRPLFARSKANALFAQTVYMDSDACPPDAFRISPSLHVDTSEGHGHDYWFLSEPVPASVVSEVAHRITTAHKAEGSDPSGWSANKVLRLPTFNTSYDEFSPYEVKWQASSEVYYLEDISAVYDDVQVDAAPDAGERVLPPVPTIEGLPDAEEVLARIPASERNLNDLIYKNPKTGDGGWQSEQRFALLLELKRFGLTDEETIAVAWAAPAASKWREDTRGVHGLWWELQAKVIPLLDMESGKSIPAAPTPAPKRGALKLLNAAERARFDTRTDLSTLYLNWARSKVKVFNAPYHHSSYWSMTAVLLSAVGEFPKDPQPMPLNLYTMDLGENATGKSEAKSMSDHIIRIGMPPATIGVRHSKESLIELLSKRDGQPTYLDDDESDGFLGEVRAGTGYLQGIRQIYTKIYDGLVPLLGKVGREDLLISGKRAIPTMRLMGTFDGMMKVLDREMFHTGFLTRQIWTIGEEIPVTQETVRTKLAQKKTPHDAMPKWWASHYAALATKIRASTPSDEPRASIWPTDEATARADKGFWQITQYFDKQDDSKMWNGIARRMSDIIWKVSALQAMTEGRMVISSRDVEVALGYAEMWLANAQVISESISETFFSKQTDEIEKFIARQKDKEVDIGAIYRLRNGEMYHVVDGYIKSLVMQSRIYEQRPNIYKIKETQ